MNDITIHYVKVLEIEYFTDDNNEDEWIAGFELKGERYRLDDAIYLQDDYFHGVISMSYSCEYYIKYLSNDIVAVAYVTC